MFNVGIGEMMVLALVALLIFGPDRLPEIMRSAGKALRSFQSESQRAAAMLKEGLEPAAGSLGVVDAPDPVAAVPAAGSEAPALSETPVADEGRGHTHSHDLPEPAIEPGAREYEDT